MSTGLQCWLGPIPSLPALPTSARRDTHSSSDRVGSAVRTSAKSPTDTHDAGGPHAQSALKFWHQIAASVKQFGTWLWPYLSTPAAAELVTADCLARLGELERQLALAALTSTPLEDDIARHQRSQVDDSQLCSGASRRRGLGTQGTKSDRVNGTGLRQSASEPDLLGRRRSRPDAVGTPSDSFGMPSAPVQRLSFRQQQQQQQQQLTAPLLSERQRRAQHHRLDSLHNALRGLIAVYDCVAPQLMHLANEISDSAEMWDALLYR